MDKKTTAQLIDPPTAIHQATFSKMDSQLEFRDRRSRDSKDLHPALDITNNSTTLVESEPHHQPITSDYNAYGMSITAKKVKKGSKVFVKRYQSTDENYRPKISNAEQLKSTYFDPVSDHSKGVFSIIPQFKKKITNKRLVNMLESKHNKKAAQIMKVQVPINFSKAQRGYSKQFKEDAATVDMSKSMFDNHSKSIKKMVSNLSQMNSYLEEERKNMQSIQPPSSKAMTLKQQREMFNKSSAAVSQDKDSERLMKLYNTSSKLQSQINLENSARRDPASPDAKARNKLRVMTRAFFTEKGKSKKASKLSQANNQTVVNEQTSLSQMPSIVTKSSLKDAFMGGYPASTKGAAAKEKAQTISGQQMQDFGVVNYVNGIPVSIELPSNYSQVPTWKQSMQKRNMKLQQNDVYKMHARNMHEQKLLDGQALPSISQP